MPTTLPGLMTTALHRRVRVVGQQRLARDTFQLRLDCPDVARRIVPGQFVMLRDSRGDDPLLGRPFALYDVFDECGQPAGIDVVYLVVGKLTSRMAAWRSDDEVQLWGPLGNGFPLPPPGHLMLIAGGIGQTPFPAVAAEALGVRRYGDPPRAVIDRPERVTFCYGVRSAEFLAGLDDFALDGLDTRLATDDGTRGHRGFVTDLLVEAIERDDAPASVFCCGPEPMMRVVAEITARHGIACWLSLETPMACGFGACFSCVVRVRQDDGGWDYRRTCVAGPVFPAERVELPS